MKLKVKQELTLTVPPHTRVIRNDEWLTLARRDGDNVKLLTIHSDDVGGWDFIEEDCWTSYGLWELRKALNVK